ncbi:hypothetical protein FNV43_RR16216 [Rhamnella rubrinervis]|uniref:Cytochrome P450 CYP72A219-like n=1 Tax=Rhamnella rubrinervis TaxID=2594499 RepID=A0A8K0GYG7_9ROSA|nr:hypothetical protein FNV43_RR16216 [Rhamnella rubrinervis]
MSQLTMEVSLCVGLIGIVITCWVWKMLNWVWFRPKKLERFLRKQGLSGNSYRLLFGDLKESSTMLKEATSKPMNLSHDISPRVLPFVHRTVKNRGKKSFLWIGSTPRVNISNSEDLKDVFVKYVNFQKPKANPLAKLLAKGVSTYHDDKWAKHRRIINPAFHLQKLKQMVPAFDVSCSEMISKWKELVVSSKDGRSCDLDVWPYLQNLTRDAISRTAFGSSYEQGRRIFELQTELAQLATTSARSIYIPGWRFLPTKMNKRMKEIDKEIKASLKDMINKREHAMRIGEDTATKDDLLGILLESNFREIQEHGNNIQKNFGMSIEDVIEECKLFYFAGQETISALLVWTMVLLSMHPNWQYRAREEVLLVFGQNKPDFDGLACLKVVNMILNEVLRLYPPAVLLVRKVYKETRLGKLTLPAEAEVSLPTMLVHHDTELWGDDATEFKPERFFNGVSKATNGRVCFFPFGWGPRICIGQNFALVEAKMALSLILQKFTFELSPSYAHAPFTVVTLQPQFGAPIILHKR